MTSEKTSAALLVKCASRDCVFRKRVAKALEDDADLPQLCSYQVQFTCTKCGDPKMCGECYETMETRLVEDLQSSMSKREVRKALWTTKYDMTKKHPLCVCICSGRLKAVLEGRQVMCVNIPTNGDTIEKKKKKKDKERDWRKLRAVYTGDGDDGELDEEQQQFIYQRTDDNIDVEVGAVARALDAFTLETFPEMKKSPAMLPPGLSPLMPICEVRKYAPFDMEFRNHRAFSTLIVPSKQHMLWMPRIIGKKGNGIRAIVTQLAAIDIQITSIRIDDVPSDSTIKRIVIAGKQPLHREICAHKLYEDINGILRKHMRDGTVQ